MGVTALFTAAAAVGGSAYVQNKEARKTRHAAEAQAAQERAALAELQAEPEPVIPIADDEASRRARRRSISAQMRRRGRASTILTDSGASGDALGV